MANKNIAWYIENTSDQVLNIGMFYYPAGTTCTALTQPSAIPRFFFDTYGSNPQSLCLEVWDGAAPAVGTFKRSNGTTYTRTSVDFAGAHPPPRTP